ncbi:enamine deaminase RidA (YjgF/YER057c/UK114 family) [Pedobacter sp. AK017]|uniref:RidA family protein n=1 Tax=Pedobacter sp. AK017 TaxID=2723073 RepID=UPI00160FF2BC|nr:Rid family hydrolase [Pedobacter sp. AK017]MBB5439950.1 enamine deaminase RidA (YjgF/YER057c/UK114 family) [Pedobacter sp. AK017]
MKKVLLMLFLSSGYFSVSAQNNRSSSYADKSNTVVKHIGAAKATGGASAVVVNEVALAHTSQFLPVDKTGQLLGKNDPKKQLDQVFENIGGALKAAGSSLDQIVKINICIADAGLMPEVKRYLGSRFSAGKKPAVSFVSGVLVHPDALIGMDVIAVAPSAATKVKYLQPANLWSAKQQASVAILPAGGVVYVSGQAAQGKIAEATRETLKQLEATLHHLGLKKEDIVQLKSFICPATDIRIVEQEMADFFAGMTIPPTVYVDWLSTNPVVEIELIAAAPKSLQKPGKQIDFITPPGMTASPVYAKVTRVNYGKKVYFSSLYGENATHAKAEVAEIYTSLEKIAKQSGTDLNHLAKATYYVANDSTSNELNAIRPKYYKADSPPAASKAKVKGVGLKDKGICIDMIGVCF